MKPMNYCLDCGAKVALTQIEHDNRQRYVCLGCERVFYQNPLVVCAAIVEHAEGILLCRRDIEPRLGQWTIPGGFMELDESSEEGTVRETYEESLASIDNLALFGIYDIVEAQQLYVIYRAKIEEKEFGTTFESSEVALYDKSKIPWEDIAFKVVRVALRDYLADSTAIYQKRIER